MTVGQRKYIGWIDRVFEGKIWFRKVQYLLSGVSLSFRGHPDKLSMKMHKVKSVFANFTKSSLQIWKSFWHRVHTWSWLIIMRRKIWIYRVIPSNDSNVCDGSYNTFPILKRGVAFSFIIKFRNWRTYLFKQTVWMAACGSCVDTFSRDYSKRLISFFQLILVIFSYKHTQFFAHFDWDIKLVTSCWKEIHVSFLPSVMRVETCHMSLTVATGSWAFTTLCKKEDK